MKKKKAAKLAREAKQQARPAKQPERKRLGFSDEFMALARAKGRRGDQLPQAAANIFKPYEHPAEVTKASPQMAMDDTFGGISEWAGGAAVIPGGMYGLSREGFLGYPYLAQLALRAENRNGVETIATECTRRWIKIQASGEVDKTKKIKELETALTQLAVRDHFRKLCEQDGFFGRSHLYVDTGDTDKPAELRTPIGDGRDKASKVKLAAKSLKGFRTVEAWLTYPIDYNATNPMKADWYRPKIWGTYGTEIDASRLLTFVGREVPDMLKPAYSFGGQSMTEIALPYVNNWLKVRQGVTDIITAYSVFVLKTNMQQQLNAGGGSMSDPGDGDALFRRADVFNMLRDNRGLMILDKDMEDFQNVSASLAGLEDLQAQAQEHMAAVWRIPIVKLLGIEPTGLNASSEGSMQSFEASIGAYQEKFFRPNLTRVIDFAMINLWGAVDDQITFVFEPLEPLNEKEIAEVDKTKAETDQIRIESSVIWPEDARRAVAASPTTPYPGLDPDDVPTPPMTETGHEFNERKTVVETPEAEKVERKEAA